MRSPDKKCVIENYFVYFSTKTFVVGTQKNHLDKAFLSMQKMINLSTPLFIARLFKH